MKILLRRKADKRVNSNATLRRVGWCLPGRAHKFVLRCKAGVSGRVHRSDMRRDSFYFLLALVALVILIGWLLFVMFAE
jgi:hypothetical protein